MAMDWSEHDDHSGFGSDGLRIAFHSILMSGSSTMSINIYYEFDDVLSLNKNACGWRQRVCSFSVC